MAEPPTAFTTQFFRRWRWGAAWLGAVLGYLLLARLRLPGEASLALWPSTGLALGQIGRAHV